MRRLKEEVTLEEKFKTWDVYMGGSEDETFRATSPKPLTTSQALHFFKAFWVKGVDE